MAYGDAREGKWRGNWRMEWVASTLHTTSEHGVSSITNADTHTSAASSRLNWRPRRFKWARPFRRKTKYGFSACAITFQTRSRILHCNRSPPFLSEPWYTQHMQLYLSHWMVNNICIWITKRTQSYRTHLERLYEAIRCSCTNFLTLVLHGGEWSVSSLGHLDPSNHFTWGRVCTEQLWAIWKTVISLALARI
jgi:hypothetical protein